MKNILLIHGPNLNKLGSRDNTQYGNITLVDLEAQVTNHALSKGFELATFQSNHEGALIDFIQSRTKECVGIILNAGAYTHYSYALHDAILDAQVPTVEVHLSNIKNREPWRSISVIEAACVHTIMGKHIQGYIEAVDYLAEHLKHEH